MTDLAQRPRSQRYAPGRRAEKPAQLDLASATAAIKPRPEQKTSPHLEKDAARAMTRTNSWTPTLERRSTYDMEDQKRQMQMTGVAAVREEPGFTERQ